MNALRIAGREVQDAFRQRAAHLFAAMVTLLCLASVLVGMHHHARLNEERTRLQQAVDRQWREQPDRHPHRVAHYGNFAFRPPSPLGFFDFGVDSFTGNSIFLEAHRQNPANFSESRHSSAMLRFGQLSLAMVLQVLVPLLIFFLGFGAITAERERGTLPLVLCQGVSSRELLWGKTLGLLALSALVLVPLLALCCLAVPPGHWPRLAFLLAAYGLYFALWCAVTVLVSALQRTSSGALLVLLGLWALLFVLVPRALPNVAERIFAAPTRAEFQIALHRAVASGGNGHDAQDPAFRAQREQLMREHGVARLEDLPVNFNGIALKEGEVRSSRIYQEHIGRLQAIYAQQNAVSDWGGLLDPYLALRSLSMALSGTDYHHFVDFTRQAEAFRFGMIDRLNDLHIREVRYAGDKQQRLDRHYWEKFEPFRYQAPDAVWALSRQGVAGLALLVWAGLLSLLLSSVKVKPC